MHEEYLKLLKETFQDLKNFDPEKIRNLVEMTKELFRELHDKIQSGDPKLQEEAEKEAISIREVLEKQMEKLVQSTGMSLEQLKAMAEGQNVLNDKEKQTIEKMKESLSDLVPKPEKKEPNRKKTKLRILG